jgi:hypothetical protein
MDGLRPQTPPSIMDDRVRRESGHQRVRGQFMWRATHAGLKWDPSHFRETRAETKIACKPLILLVSPAGFEPTTP